jgi:hypothetical protein
MRFEQVILMKSIIKLLKNTPGGLDGLRGIWLAFLILRMVVTPQLTTKASKIRTLDQALTTIDPKIKESSPRPCTTPPLTQKSQNRTHDHALHHH